MTTKEPTSNKWWKRIYPSYGSLNNAVDQISPVNPASDEFGYEEFSGKDGRTCPTCKGTGRIAKEQEDELVALIPYNDQRLKPSKTKFYVALAVLICSLLSGLTLFFLLPRTVALTEDHITDFNVSLDRNMSSTVITVITRYNISNTNYFDIQVSNVNVEAFFDQVSVGTGELNSPVKVRGRDTNYPVLITTIMTFDKINGLDFMVDLCTNPKRKVHDIVIKFQATQTTWYLQHSEQSSLTKYEYLDCSENSFIT